MPEIPDTIAQLAALQARQLLSLERGQVDALGRRLAAMRPLISERVERAGAAPSEAALVAALVDVIQRESVAAAAEVLADSLGRAWGMAPEHAAGELDAWLEHYGAAARPIDVRAVAQLEDTGALLERSEASLARYGAAVARRVRADISAGVVLRDTPDQIVDGVQAAIQGERWRAERIVRTELHHAYNAAHLTTLQHARDSAFPDLKKSAVATFDARTARDSFPVHGQVQDLEDPFVDGAGRQYLHPPGRPNDREKEIPWFDDSPVIVDGPPLDADQADTGRTGRALANVWSAGGSSAAVSEWQDAARYLITPPEGRLDLQRPWRERSLEDAWQATQDHLAASGQTHLVLARPIRPGVTDEIAGHLEGWTDDRARALRYGDAIEDRIDARRVVMAPDGPGGEALAGRREYVILPEIPRRRWQAGPLEWAGEPVTLPGEAGYTETAGPFGIASGRDESALIHLPTGRVLISGPSRFYSEQNLRELAHNLELSDLVDARGGLPGGARMIGFDERVSELDRALRLERQARRTQRALSWSKEDFEIGFFDASELDPDAERAGAWGIVEYGPTEDRAGGATLYHLRSGRAVLDGPYTRRDLRAAASELDPFLAVGDMPERQDPLWQVFDDLIDSFDDRTRRNRVDGWPYGEGLGNRYVDLGGADFLAINDDVDAGGASTWSRRTARVLQSSQGGYEVQTHNGYTRGNFFCYKTKSTYTSGNNYESADWHIVHLRSGVELHSGVGMIVQDVSSGGLPMGGWRLKEFKAVADRLETFLDKDGHVLPSKRKEWLEALDELSRQTAPGQDAREFLRGRDFNASEWRTSPALREAPPRYLPSTQGDLAPDRADALLWRSDGPDHREVDELPGFEDLLEAFGDDIPF